MRWSRVSYANKISMARMLVAGFKNFRDRFAKWGGTPPLLHGQFDAVR